MPKTSDTFDPDEYTPVAERITRFYAQHPSGRILTRPLRVTERMVLFQAEVYRSADDDGPAATGWASERPGDGDINQHSCVENTETSAVGRALANLGITAGRQRPSREEMEKVDRSRRSSVTASPTTSRGDLSACSVPEPDARTHARRAPERRVPALAVPGDFTELSELLAEAERFGYPDERAAQIRDLIRRGTRPGGEGLVSEADGPTGTVGSPTGALSVSDREAHMSGHETDAEPIMLRTVRRAQQHLREWLQRHEQR